MTAPGVVRVRPVCCVASTLALARSERLPQASVLTARLISNEMNECDENDQTLTMAKAWKVYACTSQASTCSLYLSSPPPLFFFFFAALSLSLSLVLPNTIFVFFFAFLFLSYSSVCPSERLRVFCFWRPRRHPLLLLLQHSLGIFFSASLYRYTLPMSVYRCRRQSEMNICLFDCSFSLSCPRYTSMYVYTVSLMRRLTEVTSLLLKVMSWMFAVHTWRRKAAWAWAGWRVLDGRRDLDFDWCCSFSYSWIVSRCSSNCSLNTWICKFKEPRSFSSRCSFSVRRSEF